MSTKPCETPGCEGTVYAKGLCINCYKRKRDREGKNSKPNGNGRGRPKKPPLVVVAPDGKPWWDEDATESEVRKIAIGQLKTLLTLPREEVDSMTRVHLLRIAQSLGGSGDQEARERYEQMLNKVRGA